ncbi:MAG: hypothetical protein JWM74_755, partial [Myxococcaceae bacterium]|nr:hypothetical protein [Myxococcaceae bacterium]
MAPVQRTKAGSYAETRLRIWNPLATLAFPPLEASIAAENRMNAPSFQKIRVATEGPALRIKLHNP